MDATEELRRAHDQLAELYAERLADAIDHIPSERAVLGLFCDLVLTSGAAGASGGSGAPGASGADLAVADVGCGSGRLAPWLTGRGLRPHGVDLSPEMVRVARRDHPGFPFDVADVRDLPFADASLAGVVCWYSLMYLAPDQRPRAYSELARVVRPGGHLVTGFKMGDDSARRGGRTVGVEFDIWWQSLAEVEGRLVDAGFETVFRASRPAEHPELGDQQPQGYLVARRNPAV